MLAVLDAPTFRGVADNETAGQEIARRRQALGMSVSALSEQSGIDRGTITRIEADADSVRAASVGAVRATLERLEEETGMDLPGQVSGEGLVEFRVSGNFGVDVVVSGPVRDLPALERSVAKLVREMRTKDTDGD